MLLGVLVFLSCLVITAMAWRVNQAHAEESARTRFHQEVNRSRTAILAHLQVYEDALYGTRSFFAAEPQVTRDSFHHYVASLRISERYPGIQGIGYAMRVTAGEKDDHVKQIRRQGFLEYTIKPAGERKEYTSIIYLEPFDWRNQRAFGYDMFTESVRRAAMERARDTGLTSMSGKVTLVQETNNNMQHGFLMYLPLYRRGAALDTAEDRRASLVGYIYSPFRANDFLRGAVRDPLALAFFEVYSGNEESPEWLIYRSVDGPSGNDGQALMTESVGLDFGGQTWTLRFSSLPALKAVIREGQNPLIIPGGLLSGVLLAGLIFLSGRTEGRAIRLAANMTARLRESEERMRAITESAPDAIISADSQGKIIYFNSSAHRIFGHSAAEMTGKPLTALMPERFRASHLNGLTRFVTTGETRVIGKSVELMGLRADGSEFPVSLSLSSWNAGGAACFTGILQDITKRKTAEDALRQSEGRYRGLNQELQLRNLELTAVNRELEGFSYSVSHDLRAPLRAVDGFSAALLEDYKENLDQEGRQYLDRIRAAAERMGQLIDDLLRLARTARQPLSPERINLSSMAQDIASQLQASEPERRGTIAIAPDLVADGDRGLLRLALENLLANAWKFTSKQQHAYIEFGRQTSSREGAYFVSDNGAGFDMQYADKLFGAFQRLHDNTEFSGTGIGLATVQRILHRHGGRIWADGAVGKGATFYFVLNVDTEDRANSTVA